MTKIESEIIREFPKKSLMLSNYTQVSPSMYMDIKSKGYFIK